MEEVLRPVVVLGGAVAITLVVGWCAGVALRRTDARHPETPLWGMLRQALVPFQVVLCTALLRGSYDQAHLAPGHTVAIGRVLSLVLIGATAWLVLRVVTAVVEASYSRYAATTRDPARVRRVRTQITLIQRVVFAVVCVVAVSAMLLTFPAMRTIGTSMLASAGLIGIVAGIAAQSTLGNLFAGLQIAFGDMVRIGDTVVVNGEWGTVEEITLTFLTVKTWDERRFTMPVSYFTSQPFENWSRTSPQMTGTVFFHLDHSAPVQEMREKLGEIMPTIEAWDGRDWNLTVTDSTPSTMEVRALATARDGDTLWTVRVQIRERMLSWLREEHPYALPRINTAPAILPPQDRPGGAPLPHQQPAGRSAADADTPAVEKAAGHGLEKQPRK
ncbi:MULTISPECIES: mechanosensitive ion channel family protein [Streptomyces]|uniref:Mechanosensitive ion channel n=1 Tax=Streptomyces lycii TaxID=2654337 RepID=A0ABQ7FEG0_9ACTN|nr:MULTISPECIES: mechanosensitive ion channel domain-containing protein [Streptomyces]KAF4407381.1 mechanosensitive ion channel [Streptomyces lycii]PGH50853.1 mechanosensitive ion channel protein [Streptomyces sp. Ru87]